MPLRFPSSAVLPSLAVLGGLLGLGVAARASAAVTSAPAPAMPSTAPLRDVIAGAGLVESPFRDVLVAAPVGAVVDSVFVQVGDRVRRGDVLFMLDRRTTLAEALTRREALALAEQHGREQQAVLAQAEAQLSIAESVRDPRAISGTELTDRRATVAVQAAKLASAEQERESRAAELAAALADDARRVVRAPISGEILAVGVRAGEYATPGGSTPVRLGGVDRLHVRVDIDENDAWRFVKGAPARLQLRGNSTLATPLRFEYVEPYVRPKVSLTGGSTERVDTRVLQAVYSFAPASVPVYVGQQVDVIIDVPVRTGATR